MVIVTYVYIHNENITEYGYQKDMMQSKKQPIIHYEKHYIKNITSEMLVEQENQEPTKFAPEQEALMAMYERTEHDRNT